MEWIRLIIFLQAVSAIIGFTVIFSSKDSDPVRIKAKVYEKLTTIYLLGNLIILLIIKSLN